MIVLPENEISALGTTSKDEIQNRLNALAIAIRATIVLPEHKISALGTTSDEGIASAPQGPVARRKDRPLSVEVPGIHGPKMVRARIRAINLVERPWLKNRKLLVPLHRDYDSLNPDYCTISGCG